MLGGAADPAGKVGRPAVVSGNESQALWELRAKYSARVSDAGHCLYGTFSRVWPTGQVVCEGAGVFLAATGDPVLSPIPSQVSR